MHDLLKEIINQKRKDLGSGKTVKKMEKIKKEEKSRSLFLDEFVNNGKIAVIAEIKLASPVSGTLGSEKEIIQRSLAYKEGGADAVSFITEPHYFKGDKNYIPLLKKHIDLPILQKDFVIDESQIYEAKKLGSDALLLIARIVNKDKLLKFVNICLRLGIEPVVEIQTSADLKKTLKSKARIIAVNARNLEDFEVSIDSACALIKNIPQRFIKLGFSGIKSVSEAEKYYNAGAKGILVGTTLMRTRDIKGFIKGLRNL